MQEPERDTSRLAGALRAVGEDDLARGASPEVKARLLAEVRTIGRLSRTWTSTKVLALAAVLILAAAVPLWRAIGRRQPGAAKSSAPAPAREVTTAFFPLAYSNLPSEGAQLVRMQVPRKALVAVGLVSADVPPGALTGTVQADVLVGEDGLARAVRFVRPAAQ